MVWLRVCLLVLPVLLLPGTATAGSPTGSHAVQTPYTPQQVVFDFYLDDPAKINGALYWIRALINPLLDDPYGYAPEMLDIKVVVHGTEIVTLARRNEARYRDAVQRMRYYDSLGVQFKVCGLAARDYGYTTTDFQDFVEVVPSAITELAHWQLQGYALITPVVPEKKYSIEEIR
jgi:intracellular sulfur oxidation DsrE/DsrF family protein